MEYIKEGAIFRKSDKARIYKNNTEKLVILFENLTKCFRFNDQGYEIWELCDGRHSIQSMASFFSKKYEINYGYALEVIKKFIIKLLNENLILKADSYRFENISKSYKFNFNEKNILKPKFKKFPWERIPEIFKSRAIVPFEVYIDVTSNCNLQCKHCYLNERNGEEALTTTELKLIIDKLKKAGVFLVCFLGGEPFLRKDIFEIIRYTKDRGMLVNVITNGTLLNEKMIQELKKLDLSKLSISLDGAVPETNDFIRGEGVFKKVTQNIKIAVKHKLEVRILFTLLRTNFYDIFKIHRLARTLGVKAVIINPFRLCGTALKKSEVLCPSPLENVIFWLILLPLFRKFKNPRWEAAEVKIFSFKKRIAICKAGLVSCRIDSKGNICPCPSLPLSFGNIFKEDFEYVWNSKSFENFTLNKCNGEPCLYCLFKNTCTAKCKAEIYALTGTLNSGNPRCIIGKVIKEIRFFFKN